MKNRNDNSSELELFRSLVESSIFGSYILEDNYFYYVNPAFTEIFGYSKSQFMDRNITFEDLIHPGDLPIVQENINKRLTSGISDITYRVRALKQDGSTITVEIYGYVLYHNGRRMVSGKILDVTEKVTMETKLKQSEQRLQSLFDYNTDAVCQFDVKGQLIHANPACTTITGYSNEELIEITFIPLVVSDDLEKTMHYFSLALAGESNSFEIRIIRKDGKMIYLHCKTIPIMVDGKIDGLYSIARDITNRKLSALQINHMAYYDQLTHLPNRRLFEDRLSQAFLHANQFQHMMAVMYLDIDRFKFVNDSLGHAKGDQFLQDVASRLHHCVSEGATVARIGGDEFAILLPQILGVEEALELAEAISSELNQPLLLDELEVTPSASIGIAIHDGHQEKNTNMLMREADIAMYHVKRHKKNSYAVFTKEMDTGASYRLKLENDLRKAIELDQLYVHYQPIVSLETGGMNAVEALLRWNHPEAGMISPNEFIPIAEETGTIIPIGEWVLRTACKQNKAWQMEGHPPTRISVNVSLKQLQRSDFPEMVQSILNEVDLEAKWLDLEITESILIQNEENIKNQLKQLRDIGIKISIDDFGTGYTSLNYLKTFLIDHLKIDRSFVQDINVDHSNNAIIASLITLAHSLSISVVAEGIETEEQLQFLQSNLCDEGQGYIISPPVESSKIRP